ncbi:maltose transacetylase [Mycena maculata]|uniref:Maltose transacetylase n=1 Tax=Mycena maculata TaxID=230809 RepID=A0AAD7NK36_9AGAR|nr:maltose transacetylase [Mycena maculata]
MRPTDIDEANNKRKMLRGDLHYDFTPELVAARTRCKHARERFNNAGDVSRRQLVELWRDIIQDATPLPPPAADPAADDALFATEPWVTGPVRMDYGTNIKLAPSVFINSNCTILDTCLVTIGARTLLGPNDVPPFTVVAGNPARVIRKVESLMDPEQARAKGVEPIVLGAST